MVYLSEIAAQVQEIQSRSKVDISEKDRIGFGKSGILDSEIDGVVQSQFDGYASSNVTSTVAEEEGYDGAVAAGGRQIYYYLLSCIAMSLVNILLWSCRCRLSTIC